MTDIPKKTIIVNSAPLQPGKNSFETGLLLNFNNQKKGALSIELLMVLDRKEGRSYQRIPLSGNAYLPYLSGLPSPVVAVLKKLTDEALVAHLVKNGFAWLRDADKPFEHMDGRHYALLDELTAGILQEFRPLAPAVKYLFHLLPGEPFLHKNIRPASVSSFTPQLSFVLGRGNGYLFLRCRVMLNNVSFPLEDFESGAFFLKSRNEYFLLKTVDRELLRQWGAGDAEAGPDEALRAGEATAEDAEPGPGLPAGGPLAREEELEDFLERVVKPLAEKYPVDTSQVIRQEIVDDLPEGRVYLSELNENFLLIKPKWVYADLEVEEGEEATTLVDKGSAVFTILRRRQEESVLTESIRRLHPKFSGQSNGYFYLKFSEALEKNWFIGFYHKMQELDIPILGMNGLRKFKYNTHRPEFKIIAGRGIDWFDLTIEVSYGGLLVPLQELRKAILGKQEYILLEDGSLGVLPPEWIEKYGLLMKMGKPKEGGLKVPGIHWTLLEGLELREAGDGRKDVADVGNEGAGADGAGRSLRSELEEKRSRLKGIGSSREWPVPGGVQAVLRDYQMAGYQWMCLLDEMGWGGCLADDMGLGKTLQTLCFLQHLVGRYPGETHLVVCPTSLIYNWEAELKKFAPGLAWHIHYGAGREFSAEVFGRARVIITSYGMVRSDIAHFSGFRFGYIILDESQAIKNPASLVCKAVGMLSSRNRLALSGTPVQNNTFDLYAQMDFLNPGMLGGQDFFRSEFAVPVDKNGDKLVAARLRRLVYPFMLRRTKEQVAGDLPDKTEMILWCEMGAEQQKIYSSFREHYRESILEHISGEGMGKSSIYILEGLTKLRQICDSPAILNEKEAYPNVSAKLEELIREIEENTGAHPGLLAGPVAHKALVFSQFTSMLRLIREALEERGIPYVYLDGGVTAEERRKAVKRFQEDGGVRVFLISLKAGGVGLTLTAADYVYLVDPWWNPAVEQQAIDRSHRIGQVNKVFAYRMICKDTVEEKILQLQEKKRALAADLVGDEAGFVKKLTEEDVAYLFS